MGEEMGRDGLVPVVGYGGWWILCYLLSYFSLAHDL
jgi:hypothetical protein